MKSLKKKQMRILFLVGVMLLTMAQKALAVVEWKGNELSQILAAATSEDGDPTVSDADKTNPKKTVFLYNVAKGKFLYQGESSGTHTIYSDVGIRCWIMKRQTTENGQTVNKYYIETACKNTLNDDRGSFIGNDPGNIRGPFVDMYATAWEIEPVEEGSNKYYIHNKNKDNTTSYLHANADDRNVFRDPQNTVEKRGGMNLAEWILVTEQDMLDEFNKTTVELGGNPADATFLLADPDFHRYSAEQAKWTWTPSTTGTSGNLFIGINRHFQKYNVDTKEYDWVFGSDVAEKEKDQYGDDVNEGKYWFAKILGGTGTMSQTITIHKSGWYRVQCQGEYYAPGATDNQVASLFAQSEETGGKNGITIKAPLKVVSNKIGEFATWKSGSNSEGGRYYNHYGDFTNSLMIYVDCGENNSTPVNLSLGVKVEGDNVSTETGVAIDAFRLQYCGLPAGHYLVLDEDYTKFDYMTKEADSKDVYTHAILYLHRSLKKEMWNTIILPIDLTAQQFEDTFGQTAKLARYNGVANNRLQFLVQDDKTKYDNETNGAFLKTNVPYIIWPSIEPEHKANYKYVATLTDGTTENVTVGTSYYVINDVTLNKENVKDIIVKGDDNGGYRFNGILAQDYNDDFTFIDVAHVKAGDYTFNQGKLHQFKNVYGMKGFRAWFTSTNTNPENQAKPIGVEISGVQGDEVTGLDFVETTQSNAASSAIYDLRGQKLNAKSIDELPRGIYIVNHKKYVVK